MKDWIVIYPVDNAINFSTTGTSNLYPAENATISLTLIQLIVIYPVNGYIPFLKTGALPATSGTTLWSS